MKNDKKKSYTRIRIAGAASIAGMACLTAFSVNFVLNAVNDSADREYWAAFNANKVAVVSEAPTDEIEPITELITEPVVTEPPTEADVSDPVEIEEPEPIITTEPEDPEEPDDNHSDNSDNEPVVEGKSFDLANCHLDSDDNLIYTVQKGDWLITIGRRFECDYMQIVKLNSIADPNVISTGQPLIIPIGEEMMIYAKANLQ